LILGLLTTLLLRRPLALPLVVIAYFTAAVSANAIKAMVDRPRPVVDHPLMREPTTTSFPSGHAATSFACAATLALFVPRYAVPILYVLAVAISYSRVYVGVHYPLDVLAGALLGLAVATALRLLLTALQRSPRSQRAD
jgi:undecaprenyl-diphosphatase